MTAWIRESTRAAIYVRDTPPGATGPCCTYCGVRVVEGALAGPSETGLRAARRAAAGMVDVGWKLCYALDREGHTPRVCRTMRWARGARLGGL